MKEALTNNLILKILETPYETRTPTEHRTISSIITSALPKSSPETARKLSFFLEQLPQEHQPSNDTLLLLRNDPHSDHWDTLDYHQPSLAASLAASSLTLCLSGAALKKTQFMAGSIQEEIKILQQGEYFQEVPKRRLYSVIQQAEAVVLGYGEHLRHDEGRNAQDVFLARKGEFSYAVRDGVEEKTIEIFSFREGHLFSLRPFLHESFQEGEERSPSSMPPPTQPPYIVRCKSSHGVLYRFSREFFNSQLLRYSQAMLNSNSQRLSALLQTRAEQVAEIRKPNSKLLSQKIPRSLSTELQALRDSKASCGRKGSLPKQPEPVLDISEKSYDYQTLKLSQPTRSKLYSKSQLATASFDPQKNQSDLLLWKKSKCIRLQELSKSSRPPLSKAETMMQFMKFTIQFQKTRRKPSLL